MKTLREMIDIVEGAHSTVKPIIAWVEPATCKTMSNDEYENNPFANETGDWKPIHTQEELAVWQDRREEKKRGQALGQNPVAEGQATRTCPQCDGSGEDTLDPTKSCRRCGGKGHIPMSPREQGVAEALGRKDLLARLQKDLPRVDDPKNKDAEPVNWTGPKKGDYGYTGYQGHGMPTDKQERDRIRADKQKGVKEEATPEAVQKINKLFQDKK